MKVQKITKLIFLIILPLVIVTIFIGIFVASIMGRLTPIQVTGNSMAPTLKDGSLIFGKSVSSKNINRGDIVVYTESGSNGRKLGRVIGIPNDTIEVVEGELLINGEPENKEMYSDSKSAKSFEYINNPIIYSEDLVFEVKLTNDMYYVWGDNRNASFHKEIKGKDISSVYWFCLTNCK